MTRTLSKDEIFNLPLSERLHLIETLWDSIAPNDFRMPERDQHALDAALADYRRHSDEGHPWDEVIEESFPMR